MLFFGNSLEFADALGPRLTAIPTPVKQSNNILKSSEVQRRDRRENEVRSEERLGISSNHKDVAPRISVARTEFMR